jgi:hypothetical protein
VSHLFAQQGDHSKTGAGELTTFCSEQNNVGYVFPQAKISPRFGMVSFQNWKFYGESGLAKAQVTVWIYEGSLKIEHEAVTLSQYSAQR